MASPMVETPIDKLRKTQKEIVKFYCEPA